MALLLAACQQNDTSIKIGSIDPLSGAFANVGAHDQRELQLVIEDINQRGGVLGGKSDELVEKYRKRYPDANDAFFFLTIQHPMELLVKAMEQFQTADPLNITKALEGASYEDVAGTVTMRQDNHQVSQPPYVSTCRKGARLALSTTWSEPRWGLAPTAASRQRRPSCANPSEVTTAMPVSNSNVRIHMGA